jgi:hypothetical protein
MAVGAALATGDVAGAVEVGGFDETGAEELGEAVEEQPTRMRLVTNRKPRSTHRNRFINLPPLIHYLS